MGGKNDSLGDGYSQNRANNRHEKSGKNGEYKITVPQNDLHIDVDGFKIIPPMGLGSWAAFTPCGDSAMMMGDIKMKRKH